MNLKNLLRLVVLVTGMTVFAACAPVQTSKPKYVGAGVQSINYGGKEVVLLVRDPNNKNNGGGGDSLNPYSSGGTICCFGIPLVWHPGLQVIVKFKFYPDRTWHEQLVDVPPYPEGITGNIWLAMHEDGRAEAVVSNFGPTRPEWPGRIKGYPVMSAEYEIKLRDKRIRYERGSLEDIEEGLKKNQSSMSQQEIDDFKTAIENIKKRIRRLEAEKL